MKHARQQIREAGRSALLNLPTTGSRATTGDPYAVARAKLPALVLVAADEVPNLDFAALGIDGRRVTLTVIAYAEGDAVEDDLDTIAAEVEPRLTAAPLVGDSGAGTKDIQLVRTQKRITGDGAKRTGEMHLDFAVDYRTLVGQPHMMVD